MILGGSRQVQLGEEPNDDQHQRKPQRIVQLQRLLRRHLQLPTPHDHGMCLWMLLRMPRLRLRSTKVRLQQQRLRLLRAAHMLN